MPDVRTIIEGVLKRTAESLSEAMEVYWAADEAGANDLPERNLSFHFAHQLMCKGFYLYAEANHPKKEFQGIDILAISPECNYYLACEFKKYVGHTMQRSLEDIDRVANFDLNRTSTSETMLHYGKETSEKCTKGYGLVAGLTWVGGPDPKLNLPTSSRHKPFEARVKELGGHVLEPIKLKQLEASGRYFLLSAFLD